MEVHSATSYTIGTDTLDLLLWVIVLLVQPLPYMAALLMSVVSAYPKISAKLVYGGYCSDDKNRRQVV